MRPVLTQFRILSVALTFLMLGGMPIAASQTGSEKILRVNWGGFPPTLDPQASTFGQWGISGLDFEGLTRIDEEQSVVPGAAESWEFSPDGTILTFHLRDGLRFSDGIFITADHYRYAAERMCGPHLQSNSAIYLFDVVGCEELFTSLNEGEGSPVAGESAYDAAKTRLGVHALDDRTLEIRLERPVPYLPLVAALWPFAPMKPELVEAGGPDWWTDPVTRVGSGPFRLVSMNQDAPDQRVVFARNEHYWGGEAKLDGIESRLWTIASRSRRTSAASWR